MTVSDNTVPNEIGDGMGEFQNCIAIGFSTHCSQVQGQQNALCF